MEWNKNKTSSYLIGLMFVSFCFQEVANKAFFFSPPSVIETNKV